MATSYIIDFIQSLNKEEIKIVKEQLSKSSSQKAIPASENKTKKLFAILIINSNKKYTDKELAGILNCSTGAVRVLKSRLFDKIREILVLDQHFENELVFDYREQLVLTLKKRILFIRSIFRKLNQRRLGSLKLLLSETIKIAKENEVYDVLIEALTQRKQIYGIRYGLSEYELINKEIAFYEMCFKAVHNASDAFYRLTLNDMLINQLTKKNREEHLRNSIKMLEIDYTKTKSQEVNYFKCILQIALFETEKKFNEAIIHCKKLLELIKKSTVLFTKDRVGFALANLSLFYVYTNNYKEAVLNAKKAQQHHIPNSFNYLTLKEQEFYSYFYGKNFNDANNCIEELLKHSLADKGPFRSSKFIYYQACVLFSIKHFKEALQLLNKSLEIEKDKTGWNISMRILTIMTFIELNKLREASTSIANLRKHVERTGKEKEIKPRDILILKLFRELEKDDFKRNDTSKKEVQLLTELSDKNKPTAWNYYTPELIPFHEWVKRLPEKESKVIVKKIAVFQ